MEAKNSLGEFASLLPKLGSIICIDYGTYNLGVAISDHGRLVAMPLCTIRARTWSEKIRCSQEIITKHSCCAMVLGMPFELDGLECKLAEEIRKFALELSQGKLPFLFHDERFTSKAARQVLKGCSTRKGEVIEAEDKVAASIMLGEVLENLAKLSKGSF